MSKQLVVGVEHGSYTDKKTGEVVDFFNVHTVKHSMKAVGVITDAIWVDTGRSVEMYGAFAKACEGKPEKLLNMVIDVSRDNRGYVEDMELCGVKEAAALFDF